MRFIIILTFFFVSNFSFGQQSFFSVEKSGVNGLLKEKYQGIVINGDSIRQGKYFYYYDDGRIHQEGFYKEGKPDSVWLTYFPNSGRKSLFTYKNGVRNGAFSFWNTDGTLYQNGAYLNDKLNGDLITYHSNGNIDSKSPL